MSLNRKILFNFTFALFFLFPAIAFGACGDGITGGAGTSGDPYQINDAAELAGLNNCLGASYSTKYFKLMNDIDLNVSPYNSGSGWTPIGNSSNYFYGKFDGDYKTISNLFIYLPSSSYVGLFGYTASGSTVEKVVLSNVNVNGGSYAIGSLAGYIAGTVQYTGVSSGVVTGLMRLGGLVGQNSGVLQYSYASTTVTQKAASSDCCVGGLVGGSENGGITRYSYARGKLIHTSSGQGSFGGSIGNTYLSGAMSYLYSTTRWTTLGSNPGNIGGLIGNNYVLSTNSYWDTEASGLASSGSGTGKTTAQMKDQSTYTGWDFNTIWSIDANFNEGYPYLQWQAVPPSAAPTTKASSVTSSSVNYNQMIVGWTNGNGNHRVVFAKQASTGTTSPADNTIYTANATFGSGSQIGSTGWYAVYNGTSNSVTVTGLLPETNYIFQVFEYNGSGPYALYLNDNTDTNVGAQATIALLAPTVQASGITFSAITNTQMTIGWTNGNGEKRAVFIKQASAGTTTTITNTTYTANTAFGSGSQIGSSGWYNVYNGTSNSVTVTGLSANTTYRVQVFEYNGGAGAEVYFQDSGTNNPKHQATAVAPSEITLGTGTSVTSVTEASPINIWYRSTHGQSVYTAAELNAAGISGATQITKIGFYVNSVPVRALPNFIIRMKHTTDTSVASWQSSTGMSTVYSSASYTPTAGGFDSLTLTTPFTWNGTDNIVIDTAFSLVDYDQSGTVRYYSSSNGYRSARSDSSDQTNIFSGGSTSSSKPQVKLTFTASDTTPPTISSVSSEKSNGYYKAGDTIDIVVTFSEAVTGNITVTLETGDTDRTCTLSLNNETSGSCQYTVTAGDISSDLNATISATSGNITDQSSNILSNFTPTDSLASNKNIVIDTSMPTVSLVSTSTTSTGAIISWTTSENASTQLYFGLTDSLGSTTIESDVASRVTNHTVTLSNLVPCTRYYFQAKSNDMALNIGTSTTSTFTTSGCTGNSTIIMAETSIIATSTGGTFTQNNLTIRVPTSFTNATSTATFLINKLDSSTFYNTASTPAGKNRVGNDIFNIKAFSDTLTTISTFEHNITVTLSYSDSDINGLDENSLVIYRYDGSSWHALSNCVVDTTLNKVTCDTTAFSDFAIFGNTASVSTPVPTSAVTTNSSSGGTSIYAQVENLKTMGRNDLAQELKNKWPSLFPEQNQVVVVQDQLSIAPTPTPTPTLTANISTITHSLATSTSNFATSTFYRDLEKGMEGEDVMKLQEILIRIGVGPIARELARVGATGYFGTYTKNALGEFQKINNIRPWTGYFGPRTKKFILESF